jgi:hypothetical protein
MDLEIGLRPVVEGVAGEVRGDLLVEVDVPVADVALEEIGAAGDGEAKRVTGVEASRRWGEARSRVTGALVSRAGEVRCRWRSRTPCCAHRRCVGAPG